MILDEIGSAATAASSTDANHIFYGKKSRSSSVVVIDDSDNNNGSSSSLGYVSKKSSRKNSRSNSLVDDSDVSTCSKLKRSLSNDAVSSDTSMYPKKHSRSNSIIVIDDDDADADGDSKAGHKSAAIAGVAATTLPAPLMLSIPMLSIPIPVHAVEPIKKNVDSILTVPTTVTDGSKKNSMTTSATTAMLADTVAPPPSSSLEAIAVATNAAASETVVAEVIATRPRSNSDASKYIPTYVRSSKLPPSINPSPLSGNSSANWRDRLWPSKAYFNFCRMILRCKTASNLQPRMRIDDKLSLIPPWDISKLPTISSTYDSIADHSRTFFKVLMEECRVAVTHVDDTYDYYEKKKYYSSKDSGNSQNSNGWVNCEIVEVKAIEKNSNSGNNNVGSIGTLWIVDLKVVHDASDTLASTKSNTIDFSAGDLINIHDNQTRNSYLGVVYQYDPDFESKNQVLVNGKIRSLSIDGDDNDIVQLIICIDTSKTVDDDGANISGWFPQGIIVTGAVFSIVSIGNTLTSVRETQALMSLHYIDKHLQDAILDPSKFASIGMSSPVSKHSLVDLRFNTSINNTNAIVRPSTITIKLWDTLCLQYNESQLAALRKICSNDKVENNAAITLLQGPPGTGKTRTILAIVAVILAGGVPTINKKSSKGVGIIPGSSLSGSMSGATLIGSANVATVMRLGETNASTNASVYYASKSSKKIRVLICAPSNTACNEVAYRLKTQGVLGADGIRRSSLNIVRIGYMGNKIDEGMSRNSALKRATQDEQSQIVREVAEIQLDRLIEKRRHDKPYTDARRDILLEADVVCSTLSGAGSQQLIDTILKLGDASFTFDAVIIDEAAQAVESSALIPLKYNPKTVVMIGNLSH